MDKNNEGARAPAGLTDERIGQLYREAQDQSTSGVSPSIYLARAVERELLALRAPAGLEGLTRCRADLGDAAIVHEDPAGRLVFFADVERLLATQAVEPAATLLESHVNHTASFLYPAAQAEAVGVAESSTDDDRYQLVRDLLSSAAASVATWNAGALASQQIHSALDMLDYLAAAPAPQQVAQASRNSVPHMLTVETIQGAIAFGRMGINPPPSPDHWGNEFWQIGRQLAKLGETSPWDNVTPIEKPEAQASRNDVLEEAAKACESQNDTDWPTPLGCAHAIRALKGEA